MSDRSAPELTPRQAVDRWLDRQRLDKADQTVAGYRGRLKHFVEWSEREEIDQLSSLTPWDIEEYETARRSKGLKPITLRNELITFRQFLEYYASRGVLEETVPDAVELPTLSKSDQTSDTILTADHAGALLDAYRDGSAPSYPRGHAFLELAWYTGARMGSIRGLDLSDIDFGEGYVVFRHDADEDTPLKNAGDGERIVGISEDVVSALQSYIRDERHDVTDAYGREPLFTTTNGRMARNTIRTTSYYATVPCRAGECPHGKERSTCAWYSQQQASKCPSSRSPHQIRSGSITWQLNRGLRADVVAKRVNASVEVIETHYDKASDIDEFRLRRERHLDKLGFDSDSAERDPHE